MQVKRRYIKKYLILLIICVLMVSSFSIADSEKQKINSENNKLINIKSLSGTFYFTDCFILVNGNVNKVNGPLVWIFGVYCPLIKRSFSILANNEKGESLNVIVFGKGIQFGSYINQEHIFIDINSARGFLYWSGKSIINPGNKISLICKASNISIITYE